MKIYNVGNRIVNTYIYLTKSGYIMIDTGYDNGYYSVVKKLKKLNIEVNYIFLTHAHDDHAGFLDEFLKKNPNVKVIIHPKAKDTLKKGQNSFEGGCSSILALLFCNIMKVFGRGQHIYPKIDKQNFNRFIEINDKNKDELEKILEGKIYFTPGHTKDSISLMTEEGILFCGDAAMNGFPSLNKITIWIEDKEKYIESWKKIIRLKPSKIYPGHGRKFHYLKLKENIKKLEKVKLYKLK